MKLCRFDEDRLGVVIGDKVHDVSDIQSEIRAAARYDMQGDAVIAALPVWRTRIEAAAGKAPGRPVAHAKLLAPVARPSKAMGAPANYKKHVEEMRSRADIRKAAQPRPTRGIDTAGIFLKANSSIVGPLRGLLSRPEEVVGRPVRDTDLRVEALRRFRRGLAALRLKAFLADDAE